MIEGRESSGGPHTGNKMFAPSPQEVHVPSTCLSWARTSHKLPSAPQDRKENPTKGSAGDAESPKYSLRSTSD